MLLKHGYQKVNSNNNVGSYLFLSEAEVSYGYGEAHNLLELELDRRAKFLHLGSKIYVLIQNGRELTGLVKTWTQKTRNLTDEGGRSNKSIVLLGQSLDLLLVLLESLHLFNSHPRKTQSLCLIAIDLVTQNTYAKLALALVGEYNGTGETLILGRIVVLQTDLKLNGLLEVTLLLSGQLEDDGDGLSHNFVVKFAHGDAKVALENAY
mmetsp:Transcript_74607/g.103696  ORF Transcript_74607/g.103696 Transcript_74607/m.103696 type:complete len:208 (-) Transcript_74607:32-655(-)